MGAEVSLSVGVVPRKPKNENQLNNRLGMQIVWAYLDSADSMIMRSFRPDEAAWMPL
jgi:hypothetical protein